MIYLNKVLWFCMKFGIGCGIIYTILSAYLVIRLKKVSPAEYEKAGKPLPILSSRSMMHYFLLGKYKGLTDKKLLNLFHVCRVVTILFHLAFIICITTVILMFIFHE